MTDSPNHVKCPECNGTGVYKGLNIVESCRLCGGVGHFNGIKTITKKEMKEMRAPFPPEIGYTDFTVTSDNIWIDGVNITSSGTTTYL